MHQELGRVGCLVKDGNAIFYQRKQMEKQLTIIIPCVHKRITMEGYMMKTVHSGAIKKHTAVFCITNSKTLLKV